MDWKYNYLTEQLHRTAYKKHETFIISKLIHDSDLEELKPITQHYVKRKDSGYALIDLYYPQLNIAVEIDEPHHNNTIANDIVRQNLISEQIDCSFHRISIADGNILNEVNNLKNILIREKERLQANGSFSLWIAPKIIAISDLKNNLKHTLFIKIRGKIPPEDLLSRQTGYWRIDKNKLKRIKLVVIVHDGLVTRTFSNLAFNTWSENPKKVGFTGCENVKHELVGSIINGWVSQQTITYSNDMY